MTDGLPPEDIRATAEAHAELDPSYSQAVVPQVVAILLPRKDR